MTEGEIFIVWWYDIPAVIGDLSVRFCKIKNLMRLIHNRRQIRFLNGNFMVVRWASWGCFFFPVTVR